LVNYLSLSTNSISYDMIMVGYLSSVANYISQDMNVSVSGCLSMLSQLIYKLCHFCHIGQETNVKRLS